MISYSDKITKDTWVQISADEEYVLQNKSKNDLLIKAGNEPTDAAGSIILNSMGVIASTIMSGNIWVRALNEDVLIAYAK